MALLRQHSSSPWRTSFDKLLSILGRVPLSRCTIDRPAGATLLCCNLLRTQLFNVKLAKNIYALYQISYSNRSSLPVQPHARLHPDRARSLAAHRVWRVVFSRNAFTVFIPPPRSRMHLYTSKAINHEPPHFARSGSRGRCHDLVYIRH